MTVEEAKAYRSEATEILSGSGLYVLDPMRGKFTAPESRTERLKSKGYTEVSSTDKAIVNRDFNDVATCDAVLADFRTATRVSIGSCVEFGWASALRKPIVTVMSDGNPHDHGFIHQLSTYVVSDMSEALDLLILLLNV